MPLAGTAGRPEVRSSRSSRTKEEIPQAITPTADRDQPVSRRFEPSSRTSLIGEQPNPWDLLQPQDEMHITPLLLVVQTISSSHYLKMMGAGV
jgi:hypothetical protein